MSNTRGILTATAGLCAVLISGCGHTVRESFYRVTVPDRPDALREYASWPRNLRFSPTQGVLLEFLVQGRPGGLPLVYTSMRLESGTTFRWTSRSLAWLDRLLRMLAFTAELSRSGWQESRTCVLRVKFMSRSQRQI